MDPALVSVQGELSDNEKDVSLTDADQALSEEQNYRETIYVQYKTFHGLVPHTGCCLSSTEDNPYAAPKQQPTGKICVNLPTDDWLYCKMDRFNPTLVQGYPS